jgi:hypothetical protein
MAKVTWGGADLESALDDYEDDGNQYPEYTGERPPKGVYQWNVRMDKTVSSGGFNQLIVHLTLEPHNAKTKPYKGYYCRDYIIVKEDGSTAWRVRPLLDALGVTARQFRTMTITAPTDRTNAQGGPIEQVTKIGPIKIEGLVLTASIRPDRKKPEYESIKYMAPAGDDSGSGSDDANDADDAGADDDNEPPF